MDTEGDLFSLANLKDMEIIDINTGAKLGFIKDLKIDCDENRIISVILPSQTSKMSLFSKSEDIEIPWEKIKKIGVDVILIDGEKLSDKI
ncbi:YlmC/YmxH family sporulation protein [Clostridium luticellarii]|jgi:YlmC/YmxH family sporulation protein|uniref:PRC-barrel domain protein n=1 Tax=Clostridium luticellarii TaxID=1691940 RepID=A0A2T0BRE5_9CLOT|nr:YlmC/YmxH family sporulation protein [Clostridium luticellarii]MCI1943832.1 YlmC/YmxH family sporulation protein [Clostridium luticellarii]MCI1967093.1 YlmC/YmxH family sporulation protein [Clostridium luticellarii]MCI1994460.1 YlmC/YmxH family sporulation protein [Clostridium luticellarii]MCI2038587.1 YlmC/YmxH family sporulation protein [Clostridium luticellarii]PRR86461.1 PRC-barrel domain protein [Clostridium luticellarii]